MPFFYNKITIKGEPKEIAALALELRERHGCHGQETINETMLVRRIVESINGQTSLAQTGST